ncbi:GNAT family N-acetyltransferase [Shimia sagamensis]|uniref:Acetyltransferase (GNAT) domain-containing protein n=1 Tax=Shimia sagamensis TaxID=1566352 RepID=A0ABY1NU99_9RHOB|nr:GNAT family N-acetyltransferase [Shimia sagamensis]SMP18480.1 Acetyltransferase (GNAT) domain-containing protein [Shimia sagamensis]
MIRALTAGNLNAYRSLWLHGLSADPSAFLLTAAEAVATADSALVAKLSAGEVIGAFDSEALVGFVALRRGGPERMRHMADVGPLYVHPSARRRGLARALLDAAVDAALQMGVLQLELCVDSQNLGAQVLYQACGFEQIGLRPRSVIVDGVARNDLLMLRQLDA